MVPVANEVIVSYAVYVVDEVPVIDVEVAGCTSISPPSVIKGCSIPLQKLHRQKVEGQAIISRWCCRVQEET